MVRLTARQNPGRNSGDGGAGRYGTEDYSAGADHRTLADFSSREGNRTNPDMCKRMHRHAATQEDTGGKMDVVTDSTIMLDNSGRIHDAVLSDPRTGIDHASRHDDSPLFQSGRLRNHRGRMDECGGRQTVSKGALKARGPHFVSPNGHQKLRAVFAPRQLKVPAGREDPAAAEFPARFLATIVDEGNGTELPHRPCNIENDLAVAAGAP